MYETIESLRDQQEALEYLNSTVALGQEDFLFALYNVAIAQGGLAQLAGKTGLNRESLYKILAPHGNPHLDVFLTILNNLGFQMEIVPLRRSLLPELKCEKPLRLNSIATTNPTLAEQWHAIKNSPMVPNDITPTSRKKVWWKCSKVESHEWEASALSMIKEFKINFLKYKRYTEEEFSAQLKQACPLCMRMKANE
ncbi:MAG: zinc-ribbon domain-containing protein [Candidatus Babeliaceae bacterium]|jgi:probable addiction module antidote protein